MTTRTELLQFLSWASDVHSVQLRDYEGELPLHPRDEDENTRLLVETYLAENAEMRLDAVRRVVFLHGKENRDSVVYREAVEELACLGLGPG